MKALCIHALWVPISAPMNRVMSRSGGSRTSNRVSWISPSSALWVYIARNWIPEPSPLNLVQDHKLGLALCVSSQLVSILFLSTGLYLTLFLSSHLSI